MNARANDKEKFPFIIFLGEKCAKSINSRHRAYKYKTLIIMTQMAL